MMGGWMSHAWLVTGDLLLPKKPNEIEHGHRNSGFIMIYPLIAW